MNFSSMALVLPGVQQTGQNLRLKILKNEEKRLELEQKLRLMSSKSSHSYQKRQIAHIERYFQRLNQDSQRAQQRNLQLIEDLSQAQDRLDQLHFDAQHLIDLKNQYCHYLESHYPKWQRPISIKPPIDDYTRLADQIHLDSSGNLRQVQQSYDGDSSMLIKHYQDQLKTNSPINKDEQSMSESMAYSNVKRTGSLRMDLTRQGLSFLLDYLEREFREAIDKKKFYRVDPPTITQKRTILDLANRQQSNELKDHDSTMISMIILDQLPSTIRRTTVHQCLLTEDILSMNIQDLDKNIIAHMIPEQDRQLWLRLIDHLSQLLKNHIMNISTIIDKFSLAFLPANILYIQDKAKSLFKHILEKLAGTQTSSSDDETSSSKKQINNQLSSSSSWMKKLRNGSAFDDNDDDSTSSTSTMKINNRSATKPNDDSDQDFFE